MDVPVDLAGRLKLALKVVNLSPGALAATVGVDKSVVSRWLAGKVVPNGHNMSRIAAEITRRRPDFSALMFEAPGDVVPCVARAASRRGRSRRVMGWSCRMAHSTSRDARRRGGAPNTSATTRCITGRSRTPAGSREWH